MGYWLSIAFLLSVGPAWAVRIMESRPVPDNPVPYGTEINLSISVELYVQPFLVCKPTEVTTSSNTTLIKIYLTFPELIHPLSAGHSETVTLEPLPIGFHQYEIQVFANHRTNVFTTNGFGSFWVLPKLNFSHQASFVTLAWPAVATNFVLQATTNFNAGAEEWRDWNLPIHTIGTNSLVTNAFDGQARFFRLREKQ